MPRQNHNAGSGSDGPHRQGEKGGKGGTVAKAGRSSGDGSGKSGNKQTGPFSAQDDDKRPKVASDDRKSGFMAGER